MFDKLALEEIPSEGRSVELEVPLGRFTTDDDGFVALKPISSSLELRLVQSAVLISGSVRAEVSVPCSRCLGPSTTAVEDQFRVTLIPLEEYEKCSDGDLGQDDLEVDVLHSNELDLVEIVREQVILGLPMQPLCREDCRGLCSNCGADLNAGQCDCDKQQTDSPFSVLKDLLPEDASPQKKER